jgi:pyruvate/2-oxoglutarate dehydrogenase complex dihydrolipoamide acyltransferase (E2) component
MGHDHCRLVLFLRSFSSHEDRINLVTIPDGRVFHVGGFMTRTNPFLVSAILLAGLTSACGQNAATAEDGAKNAATAEAMPENITALDMPVRDEASAATPAAAETAAASAATKEAPAAAPAQAATATLKSLPLKRGFYVSSDTPCNQASNATLRLVTREGINFARDICTFRKIEKTGATSYRVTESCSGEPQAYEIPNDTTFTVTYEGGSQSSARYCAQSSLPDPWRDNDISDITG